ncbi:MAG: EutN/CcmL family microcompartment protein [Lachnospiraceae bacterium]|nr:EutN/CcmL family microcompartment protein [Lachnospiraceae bacterium]
MIVGKVVGSVVSTRKSEKLIGNKFMIIEPVQHVKSSQASRVRVENTMSGLEENPWQMVAIDLIGAGIGEYVLVATGSAARIGCGMENAPVDAAIVGIIDDGSEL